MENIEAILLELKDKALEATKNADGAFYQSYLSDDAMAIVPYGIFDKAAIVQQMGSANSSFKSSEIEDTKAVVLNQDTGIITYKATYDKPGGGSFQVFVTTVYAKINDEWKGVFYQQTPLQTPGS